MASVGVTVAVAAVVAVVVVVLAAELRARVCEVGEEGEVGGGEQAVERHGAPVERGAGMARKDHRGAGDARSHALGRRVSGERTLGCARVQWTRSRCRRRRCSRP